VKRKIARALAGSGLYMLGFTRNFYLVKPAGTVVIY